MAKQVETVTLTGTLVDGINQVGGETTGWALQTHGSGGIEVNVSQVEPQAMKLRGQKVTITGYFTTVGYIERGPTKVLVAEKICTA